jgi:hypothetical protein
MDDTGQTQPDLSGDVTQGSSVVAAGGENVRRCFNYFLPPLRCFGVWAPTYRRLGGGGHRGGHSFMIANFDKIVALVLFSMVFSSYGPLRRTQ